MATDPEMATPREIHHGNFDAVLLQQFRLHDFRRRPTRSKLQSIGEWNRGHASQHRTIQRRHRFDAEPLTEHLLHLDGQSMISLTNHRPASKAVHESNGLAGEKPRRWIKGPLPVEFCRE